MIIAVITRVSGRTPLLCLKRLSLQSLSEGSTAMWLYGVVIVPFLPGRVREVNLKKELLV